MATAIKTAVGPTILLHSGHYFDFLDPAGSRFTVTDIAAGLGRTCRFAGQSRAFYSVAEHSWHASLQVPEHLRLAALLHDAAEAFLGDVTRPLKSLLPEYKVIEADVERVIFERFGVAEAMADPTIKRVDLEMLAAEQADMMPPHADHWACLAGIRPALVNFRYWSPEEASHHWLARFEALANIFPAHDLERLPASTG